MSYHFDYDPYEGEAIDEDSYGTERTLQQLGDQLLEHCVRENRYDVTNNQIQRILKIGLYRINELIEYLLKADRINVTGDGKYRII